ncbi:ribonuclease T2-like [Engystomops pustulosus]|uniref:ribonuclease T2-like n=1 Tax=Engystomops pustulosus TaxID=76066 RepID=UPI003AFAACA3
MLFVSFFLVMYVSCMDDSWIFRDVHTDSQHRFHHNGIAFNLEKKAFKTSKGEQSGSPDQQRTRDYKEKRNHTGWSKLILVHQWPVTVCKMAERHCGHLPNYWTLHGLWPDKAAMCNSSWPLDISNIQDLLAEMNKWWPDVLHPNCSDFWKHEWIKHGTCAASLSSLNSQHKYFSKGLELYSRLDLNR